MTKDLSRLFRPKSIAVVGGGAWCRAVIEQCQKMGFNGAIYPVHPKAAEIYKIRAYSGLNQLPEAPDACFIGVNRQATIDVVGTLAKLGAGGAVCFASGFAEAKAEDEAAGGLQSLLLEAAGDMPILGPNCYGFINALDGALLWPDQHGCTTVKSGVAILTQSSNMAINLTMQNRGLPIAYMVTAGNQAQTTQAEMAAALIDDPRVTAIGVHIEGFGDLRAWEMLADKAYTAGKPIVAIKVGQSEQARAATISHTASLAGEDAGAAAFLRRLGIPRLHSLPAFLETLKLLHLTGPLPSNRLASISCSGGEASLAADTAIGRSVVFPELNERQKHDLRDALGPMVALANPLDYHTYIWRDGPAMTRAWAAMMDPSIALTMLIVDFPRSDICDAGDWECAIEAALGAKELTGANVAMVATLPELMPEDVAKRLMSGGVVPISGLAEAIVAAEAAASFKSPTSTPVFLENEPSSACLVSEMDTKRKLSTFGLDIPKGAHVDDKSNLKTAADTLSFPLVLKGEGIAHKTEAGLVALNLKDADQVSEAGINMPCDCFLLEEMISDSVAELLIGVTHDPAHGFVLTLGAGGTLTELLDDSQSLLLPTDEYSIKEALSRLKVASLLNGYRGKAAANLPAILHAVQAVQAYVLANGSHVEEIEINPLICTPTRAVAADALLREAP